MARRVWWVGVGSVLGALFPGLSQAQTPPSGAPTAPPGPPQTPTTALVRQSTGTPRLGGFDGPAPPPPPRPPPGEVGTTGAVVTEDQGPTGQLRGPSGPAPGEVDMTTPIGPGDATRILRLQESRFRPCYERALATHRNLAGRVQLRFTIGRRGEVVNPSAAGLPEAPEVATCIAETLRVFRFPPPQTGTLPMSYAVNYAPPAPAARPPRRPPRRPAR
ncbi:MAG: AgmX/PglI C-terminal domain-containing protein [Deltaproteobacteria bacterium]|nr:AgmX/PglI C-terminal domain-containing protein [Deltaproteobacteria bacterium]